MEYLAGVALRALLLGGMGALAACMVRRRAAEVRHIVWVTVLAGMLALPLLMATLPPIRILPARVLDIVSASVPPTASGPAPSEPAQAASRGRAGVSAKPPDGNVTPPGWRTVLLAVYFAGMAILLLRTAALIHGATLAVSASERVRDAGACALLEDTAASLEMGYPLPELRESAAVSVPFTAGRSTPVIVLPAGWRAWDQFKLQSVLAHELAHVRRNDWATSVAATVNRALFWYHPLAWWLERRLAALAEEACDAAAIRSAGDERRYAGVLIEFAATAGGRSVWTATSMARSSRVGWRIGRILEGRVIGGHSVTVGAWVLILSLALPAVYSAAALQLQPQVPEQANNATPASAQAVRVAHQSVLTEGWELTPEGAARLESGLAIDPQDIPARVRLISYYYQRMLAEPRARHILWLIENHPEADVFRVAHDVTNMQFPDWTGLNTQAGSERAKELWLRQMEQHQTDTRILANAVDAALFDPDTKLRLVRQLRVLEPNNSEWTTWLASVYARAAWHVFFERAPVSRSFAGPQLWQAFPTSLPTAEKLKTELETSTDAALVGETGEQLTAEAEMVRRFGLPYTPELAASAAFGTSLLERARALEPANPRWQRQ